MDQFENQRWTRAILALLVVAPIVFNAIVLLPELTVPVPTTNDSNAHFLMVRQASAALEQGANPFDFWLPQLELGFPQFLYYQHLPHLAVVALHRLLLKQVGLFTLFNLVRYLLMVLFPVTVLWSMRTMGFSAIAAAIGAACSSLFASDFHYGFDFDSYIWIGFGMYTQLWGVHLFFISIACLQRLLTRGTGYLAAIVSTSALALSHLLYAYIMAGSAIVLFLLALRRGSDAP
ncbi:MAG TPA: hypothetical protein VEC38_09655 [Candidatus Binataceae bacterium]|nr:hypothetical protein [Candidatus Binataceae bacterium]